MTVRRITSGELLKQRNGFLIHEGYGQPPLNSSPIVLTMPRMPPFGERAEAVQNTLATLGFGLAEQTGIRGPVGSRLVLLTPDAAPEAARIAMGAKPEHWRIVIEPSPMPPILEDLAASIEADDRAWLEANRAKCEEASFAFNPAIKRIEVSGYHAG
jgi:hypothetical protein